MALTPEEQAELEMLQTELPKLQAQFTQYQQQQAAQPAQPAAQPAAPEAPPADPNTSGFEDFKRGLGLSAAETAFGIKSLFTDLSDQDKSVLKMWRDDVEGSGGWGSAGGAVGDIAQLAVPAKYVGALGKTVGGARGVLAADAALGAGHGALQAGANEDASRTGAAAEGALGAVLGAGVARALGKTLSGLKQSDAAKYLSELGVKLTPAQAAQSGFPKMMEHAMSLMPVLGKSVKTQREKSLKSFNQAALQKAAPEGATITSGGQKGARELKEAFDTGYDDAWKSANELKFNDLAQLVQTSQMQLDPIGDAGKRVSNRVFDAVKRLDGSENQVKDLRNLDRVLRDEYDRAFQSKDWGLTDAISNIRNDLSDRVGPQTKEALDAMNKKYGEYKVVRDAGSSTKATETGEFGDMGYFDPRGLNQSISKVAGQRPKGRNDVFTFSDPFQQMAAAGAKTVSDADLWKPLDAWKRIVGERTPSFGIGGLLEAGADASLGRTATQKELRKLAAALREQGLRGSVVGTAATDGE